MKKYLIKFSVFIVLLFVFTGIPLQIINVGPVQWAYAMGRGVGHGGNHSGGGSIGSNPGGGSFVEHSNGGSTHRVPDPVTTLAFLGIGVAAVGGYSLFRKGKRK